MTRFLVISTAMLPLAFALRAAGDEPLAVRVETLTVPPSTQPLAFALVKNTRDRTFRGSVAVQPPEGWKLAPPRHEITLAPGESQRLAFNIEKGRNVEANRYLFRVTVDSGSSSVTSTCATFVASAPYFKITADGETDEWKDAIPITFTTGGKRTEIRTYWNRRSFSLFVAVQEDRLTRYGGGKPFDAVQFSLAPLEVDAAPGEPKAERFEFLLAATGDGATCFQLADMTTPLVETQRPRPLEPLVCEDADVAAARRGDTTIYECRLSFRSIREVMLPSEGREFFMSVLVHDPDGTGIRDLGQHAGLWPMGSDATGWTRWPGAVWGKAPPRGPRVLWGMCTSKY